MKVFGQSIWSCCGLKTPAPEVVVLSFTVILLFFSSAARSSAVGIIDIPQTGQTTVYTAGDDGDQQAGVAWPSPRFRENRDGRENGDGTVTDILTGLVWLKNANCFGMQTWANALNAANTLNSGECGLTDGSVAGAWRLPNVNELENLINEGASTLTWLNGQGFTDVQSNYYWSSTTHTKDTVGAWTVWYSVKAFAKTGKLFVWPVRAGTRPPAELWKTGQTTSYAAKDDGDLERGVAWPSPRFANNGDGTVTDNLTGLIWLKNPDCFGSRTWAGALNAANTLNHGECGLTDGSVAGAWRLPNIKELRSLIDYSRYFPALPAGNPFIGLSVFYWSSSTPVGYTDSAWTVDMTDGDVFGGQKSAPHYHVWPVRGGFVNSKPTIGTLTPSSVTTSGGAGQTFTAVYKDANGYADLKTVDFLVSPTGSGANAIWARYITATNELRLYNDAGAKLLAAHCTPGVAGTLQNSQGKINCGATTVTGSGKNLTVKWRVIPKAGFVDALTPKKLKMKAVDNAGATYGWKVKGSWLILNP